MKYDEALREWGKVRLENDGWNGVMEDSIIVNFEFDEGYACCGGSDPDCYCSFAESPSAQVTINGVTLAGITCRTYISHYSFDFATILKEIVEAAGGVEP